MLRLCFGRIVSKVSLPSWARSLLLPDSFVASPYVTPAPHVVRCAVPRRSCGFVICIAPRRSCRWSTGRCHPCAQPLSSIVPVVASCLSPSLVDDYCRRLQPKSLSVSGPSHDTHYNWSYFLSRSLLRGHISIEIRRIPLFIVEMR